MPGSDDCGTHIGAWQRFVQAGFPPKGVDLASACWASFDIFAMREEVRRE